MNNEFIIWAALTVVVAIGALLVLVLVDVPEFDRETPAYSPGDGTDGLAGAPAPSVPGEDRLG